MCPDKDTTSLASISLEGMGSALAVEGSTTATVFEANPERVLLPELDEGQVLVMDDLPAHMPDKARELIEGRGRELLYLPGYSPDYAPIEEAFSKIKNVLTQLAACTQEALLEAMERRSPRSLLPTLLDGLIPVATRSRFSTCEYRR